MAVKQNEQAIDLSIVVNSWLSDVGWEEDQGGFEETKLSIGELPALR